METSSEDSDSELHIVKPDDKVESNGNGTKRKKGTRKRYTIKKT